MMYAPNQGTAFPDGSAAMKQCSADGISALIIHPLDSISASIIHTWVHCMLRKICIFIVYSVTVQHFIKFNVTELSMQACELFNLFKVAPIMLVGDLRTKNGVTYYTTKANTMLLNGLCPLVRVKSDVIRRNYS